MPSSTLTATTTTTSRPSFLQRLRQSWRKKRRRRKQPVKQQQQHVPTLQQQQQQQQQQQHSLTTNCKQQQQSTLHTTIKEEAMMRPTAEHDHQHHLQLQEEDASESLQSPSNSPQKPSCSEEMHKKNDSFSTGCCSSMSSEEDLARKKSLVVEVEEDSLVPTTSDESSSSSFSNSSPLLLSSGGTMPLNQLLPTKVAPLRDTETARRLQLLWSRRPASNQGDCVAFKEDSESENPSEEAELSINLSDTHIQSESRSSQQSATRRRNSRLSWMRAKRQARHETLPQREEGHEEKDISDHPSPETFNRAWANELVQRVCRGPQEQQFTLPRSDSTPEYEDDGPQPGITLLEDVDETYEREAITHDVPSDTTTNESFPALTQDVLRQFDQHLKQEQEHQRQKRSFNESPCSTPHQSLPMSSPLLSDPNSPHKYQQKRASTQYTASIYSLATSPSSQYTTVTVLSSSIVSMGDAVGSLQWEVLQDDDDDDTATDEGAKPVICIELDHGILQRASSAVTSIYEEITIDSEEEEDIYYGSSLASSAYTEELIISQDEPLSVTRQRWKKQVETWDTVPSDLDDEEFEYFEEETVDSGVLLDQEPEEERTRYGMHHQHRISATMNHARSRVVAHSLPTDKTTTASHNVVNLTFLAHPLSPSTVDRMIRQAWDMLRPGGKMFITYVYHEDTRVNLSFNVGTTLHGLIPSIVQNHVELVGGGSNRSPCVEQLRGELETEIILKSSGSYWHYDCFYKARHQGALERWKGIKPIDGPQELT